MILRELLEDTTVRSIERMANSPPEKCADRIRTRSRMCTIAHQYIATSTHTNCYILGKPGGDRIIIDPAAKCVDGLGQLQQKIDAVIDEGSSIIATIFTHRHQTILATWMQFPNSIKHPFGAVQETLAAIPHSSDTHTLIDGDAFELDGVQWNVIRTPGHCPDS